MQSLTSILFKMTLQVNLLLVWHADVLHMAAFKCLQCELDSCDFKTPLVFNSINHVYLIGAAAAIQPLCLSFPGACFHQHHWYRPFSPLWKNPPADFKHSSAWLDKFWQYENVGSYLSITEPYSYSKMSSHQLSGCLTLHSQSYFKECNATFALLDSDRSDDTQKWMWYRPGPTMM